MRNVTQCQVISFAPAMTKAVSFLPDDGGRRRARRGRARVTSDRHSAANSHLGSLRAQLHTTRGGGGGAFGSESVDVRKREGPFEKERERERERDVVEKAALWQSADSSTSATMLERGSLGGRGGGGRG